MSGQGDGRAGICAAALVGRGAARSAPVAAALAAFARPAVRRQRYGKTEVRDCIDARRFERIRREQDLGMSEASLPAASARRAASSAASGGVDGARPDKRGASQPLRTWARQPRRTVDQHEHDALLARD